MNEHVNHFEAETLSAYVDGELDAVSVGRVERHVSECAPCRETLRKVHALVAAAHALPRDVAPPPGVWNELRARVAREPRPRYIVARWWHNGWFAAAAAILLIVGTSLLMPRSAGKAKGAKLPPIPVATLTAPVVLLAVDRNYSATLDQLREALNAQRPALSPSTVRTVERSLAVIDSAIAEARQALALDPANQALVDILSASYERKVDLLQRATELSSSL
jgi:putative zinc finger protein